MSRKFVNRRGRKPELVKVGITGPRPENLCGVPDAHLRSSIRDQLEIELEAHDGLVHAYSGMARGVDTVFATQALRMGIELHAVIPFEGFEARWSAADQRKLETLLAKAASIQVVCEEGSKEAYQRRNEALVDNVNILLGYYVPGKAGGTANCLAYAKDRPVWVRKFVVTELFEQLNG
jgi:uncharacterized phage-like protein YoqJ